MKLVSRDLCVVLLVSFVSTRLLGQQRTDGQESTVSKSQPVRLLTSDEHYDDGFAAASPDGKKVVFARGPADQSGKSRLWVIALDGGEAHPLSPENFPFNCTRPAWSPDGTTIAFRAGRADEKAGGIWLMSSEGSNLRRLTDEEEFDDIYPVWSPDGKWHVFSRGPITQEYTNDLWQVILDGWQQQRGTDGGCAHQPDRHFEETRHQPVRLLARHLRTHQHPSTEPPRRVASRSVAGRAAVKFEEGERIAQMVSPRRPPGGGWVYDPARVFRRSKAQVPPYIQRKLERRARDLIDSTLKPRHIQPPPQKAQFNYLVDIYSKWRGPFFYFCSKYRSPGPNALSDSFESKFARLQYAGSGRFNLAYFRHTGEWWEVAKLLSLEKCLAWIESGNIFSP